MYIRALVPLGAAALLAACQTAAYEGEASPFVAVPPGSRLILNRELTVPAHQVSVHIQNGRILPSSEMNQYYPFCKFELYSMSGTARTVVPQEMTITRTVRDETTYGALTPGRPVRVAQLGLGFRTMLGGKQNGPSLHAFSTRMNLRSEKQPDIFRLTCAQWEFPGYGRHVAISEIRRTLEPLFTLRLPAESG